MQDTNDAYRFDLLPMPLETPDKTTTPPSSQPTTTEGTPNLPDCPVKSETRRSAMEIERENLSDLDRPSYDLDAVNPMCVPKGDEAPEGRGVEWEVLEPIQHNQEDDSDNAKHFHCSSTTSNPESNLQFIKNMNMQDPRGEQLSFSDMAAVHSTQPSGIQSLLSQHSLDGERCNNP